MAIEYLPLAELKPDPNNVRSHSKQQLRQIAKSISTFGFGVPILVDGENRVLAGHGRLEACRLVGLTEAPVVRLAHLSEAQARAFQIADNRLTELGGWDDRQLGQTLLDLSLQDLTFDLEATGFQMAEIDLKIEGLRLEPTSEEADEEPLVSGPQISKSGDLWRLGRHKLLCGDALSPVSYDALMGEDRADIVVADPPYNVPVQGHVGGRGKIKLREFAMAAGEMTEAEFTAFLGTVFGLCAAHSKNGSLHYCFIDWRHLHEVTSAGKRVFGELKNICVWAKTQAGQGAFYRSQHELIAVFKNGESPSRNNIQLGRFGRNRSNLWTYPSPSSFGRAGEEGSLLAAHPTPKNVTMVADALLDASARGDIVLDPFAGGGVTVIAAERVGRICYAIEIDPIYVDTVIRRFIRQTGQDAIRASDGASFQFLEQEVADHGE